MHKAVFSLVSMVASAADLNGVWLGYLFNRNGVKIDVSMKLTQTGDKVGGKVYGDYKSNPVVEGSVTGEEINFVVVATEQAGNEVNNSRLRFSGKFINENEIELSRERESTSSAGNTGNNSTTASNPAKQNVKLKRLIRITAPNP